MAETRDLNDNLRRADCALFDAERQRGAKNYFSTLTHFNCNYFFTFLIFILTNTVFLLANRGEVYISTTQLR